MYGSHPGNLQRGPLLFQEVININVRKEIKDNKRRVSFIFSLNVLYKTSYIYNMVFSHSTEEAVFRKCPSVAKQRSLIFCPRQFGVLRNGIIKRAFMYRVWHSHVTSLCLFCRKWNILYSTCVTFGNYFVCFVLLEPNLSLKTVFYASFFSGVFYVMEIFLRTLKYKTPFRYIM